MNIKIKILFALLLILFNAQLLPSSFYRNSSQEERKTTEYEETRAKAIRQCDERSAIKQQEQKLQTALDRITEEFEILTDNDELLGRGTLEQKQRERFQLLYEYKQEVLRCKGLGLILPLFPDDN